MSDKIKKVYYTIAEVATMVRKPKSTLRYWETQFDWIRPRRSSSGERRYMDWDIDAIMSVDNLLSAAQLTIEGVIRAHIMNYNEELNDFILEKHADFIYKDDEQPYAGKHSNLTIV